MKKGLFITSAMVLLLVFLVQYAASGNQKAEAVSQEQIRQNIHRIQIPFIANNGQMDERVTFYANTFGGTVFVTKDGEIVYALPKSKSEGIGGRDQDSEKCRGELHSPDVIHDARQINDLHPPTPIIIPTNTITPTPKASPTTLKSKIFGYIMDEIDNPVKKAKVRCKGKNTNVKENATTNKQGYFEFNNLSADSYKITVKKKGFNKSKYNVNLEEGEEKEVEIVLEEK